MNGWDLVQDWEDYLFSEVFELTNSQRMIEYVSWPGLSKLFLASGKFNVLQKKMFAISLYRYNVCI